MGTENENSWDHLLGRIEEMFDNKLKNIATKQDLNGVHQELIKLRAENVEMRAEISQLKQNEKTLMKRIHMTEKLSRRSNIIVSGVTGKDNNEVQQSFAELCKKVLQVNAQTMNTRKINATNYCVELSSANEVGMILSNGHKLKGTGVYVRKDYTAEESTQRYKLRQIKNCLKNVNNNQVQIKGTTLIIENKRYEWSIEDSQVVADKQEEAEYLQTLLNSADAKQRELLINKVGTFGYGVKPRRNSSGRNSYNSKISPAAV